MRATARAGASAPERSDEGTAAARDGRAASVHALNIHGLFFERWCEEIVRTVRDWSVEAIEEPLERAQLDYLRRQLGLDAHPPEAISDFRRSRVA